MPPLARMRRQILDGWHRWGWVSERAGRYGSSSILLCIYPPDSSRFERRLARLARLWPLLSVSIILAKVGTSHLLPAVSYLMAGLIGLSFTAGVGVALTRMTAPVRRRVVEHFASVPRSASSTETHRYLAIVEDFHQLRRAERSFDRGAADWPEFQHTWNEVYARSRTHDSD